MKQLLHQLKQHRYFLLFILLFAYAHSIQIRLWVRGKLSWYIFTPEAAVGTLISACFLFAILLFVMKRWYKEPQFRLKQTFNIFSLSLLLYLLLKKLFGLIISVIFNTVEKNFNPGTILHSFTSDLMDAFIYGSFFLAYYYYQKNKQSQHQIALYNQALSENKINQLKAQLNPHFLFNNLNVLDQLIEEDKQQASDFLNEFAEIYRYVLTSSDRPLVTVAEEVAFAEQYFKLMQYKYGEAYQLNLIKSEVSTGYIVPLTLQLLLENAIQHNLGTTKNPVIITISIDQFIVVSNNINLKQNPKAPSGKALKNLKEQYGLLSDKKMTVVKTPTVFSVTLPLIQTTKHD